jgi:hypothetical protein
MLFSTQITDERTRAAWSNLADAHEAFAVELARTFTPGSTLKLGPVVHRGRYASFDIAGIVDGAIWSFSVVFPCGMCEADIWSLWSGTFMDAGLRVEDDPTHWETITAANDEELRRLGMG